MDRDHHHPGLARSAFTAFGYANPTTAPALPDPADPGRGEEAAHLKYASDVIEVVETYLCLPALGSFLAIAAAKRLQSGRLDAYLAYMLIALVAVIAVATALA